MDLTTFILVVMVLYSVFLLAFANVKMFNNKSTSTKWKLVSVIAAIPTFFFGYLIYKYKYKKSNDSLEKYSPRNIQEKSKSSLKDGYNNVDVDDRIPGMTGMMSEIDSDDMDAQSLNDTKLKSLLMI
jgi:hypothetical protein